MLNNESALIIQHFFSSYRIKKKIASQQAITSSPHSQLLHAFDLRFQCMRAVAAGKFPTNKPLDDPEQIARVISAVKDLASEKGIINLNAVAQLFQHNITLSTKIQSPYYDFIWKASQRDGERDIQKLINNAYAQLRSLVRSSDLSIDCQQDKLCFTPADVLTLARDIIQHASKTIINILANPANHEFDEASQEKFAKAIEKMLANYMTPTVLSHNKETIQLLTQSVTACSMR